MNATFSLTAQHISDAWCVVDGDPTDGQHHARWWPNDDAAAEIEASADPTATAVRICREQPARGDWQD